MIKSHYVKPNKFTRRLKDFTHYVNIQDINDSSNSYDESFDQDELDSIHSSLHVDKTDIYIHRIVHNIEPHSDGKFVEWQSMKRKVLMLVLGIKSLRTDYPDTSKPLLMNGKDFIELRVGGLYEFNAAVTHALFTNQQVDVACFWSRKYTN